MYFSPSSNLVPCGNEVEVWFQADCELSAEDLRLSSKISCEEGASPMEDQEILGSLLPFCLIFSSPFSP